MNIPELALGIVLIVGYLALRLGLTYRQEKKRRSQTQRLGDQIQTALQMVLGIVMLAAGFYFIWMAVG